MRAALVLLAACQVGGDGAPVPTPDSPQAGDAPSGGTPGTLRLAITTTPAGGSYSPKNCAVVWIEDQGGAIVKTIDRQCGVRSQHLVAWTGKSGGAGTDTDAVTGASRTSHQQPIAVTWDLKDRAGAIVADGTYAIRMELTDQNATTAAVNHQGMFTFTKGAQADARTGLTSDGFENVSITYTP